jgi:hypothetical protein
MGLFRKSNDKINDRHHGSTTDSTSIDYQSQSQSYSPGPSESHAQSYQNYNPDQIYNSNLNSSYGNPTDGYTWHSRIRAYQAPTSTITHGQSTRAGSDALGLPGASVSLGRLDRDTDSDGNSASEDGDHGRELLSKFKKRFKRVQS